MKKEDSLWNFTKLKNSWILLNWNYINFVCIGHFWIKEPIGLRLIIIKAMIE